MYRFLLSPRWLGFVAFVLVMVAACLVLANWQLSRLDERNARNDLVRSNTEQPAVPVDELLTPGEPLPDDLVWRNVTITGRYDAAEERFVRKRTYQGQVGFHVVAPLVGTDGVVLWVNRGWIPGAANALTTPDSPALPDGAVEATVRLRQAPEGEAGPEGLPAQLVERVAVEDLSSGLGRPVYLAYGELVGEEPTRADAPAPVPAPDVDGGPHLSYALQWVCFAVIAVVGLFVFARKEQERIDTEV